MIVGTAGHIDHGKTSLVRRLTGRNTDRLPEEIKRGISIELGYAYVPLAGGDVLGFVDVPGHEKFVHTMVSGATGIDLGLLVVAADDGVMPQTEEHFDILQLLGVARGAVALTKIDTVDAARVGEVRAQLARWLAGTPAAGWPVFALSSMTGEGVAELDGFLRRTAGEAAARPASGLFRLAVDRVFTLAGVGTVVTGTVQAGAVQVGEEVVIAPSGPRARVRSIHAQDQTAQQGRAGQRCALNLAGLAREDVERGQWVQASLLENRSERFDASIRLAAHDGLRLGQRANALLHHGTDHVAAQIALLDADALAAGGQALATVTVQAPLALCRGDRFVLRDPSARHTLGGGIVLDIAPPLRGKRRPARLRLLEALRDAPASEALAVWLEAGPVPLARLSNGWNLTAAELQALLQACGARVAAGTAFARENWQALRRRALDAVTATHEREPEMPGLEQNRLRRIVAPNLDADALAESVDELLQEGLLVRRGAFLALPAHRAELARDERVRWEGIKPLLMDRPFEPPRVRDIARATGIAEAEVRSVLKKVARIG
ncbi:MAG: selenocysteine-specific translation elongation factor, partial [Burkholderiaceae bacterium]|nr:selenocysteine-specific translation elongation factor [Burkholderiaceae bacterium]